MHLDNLFCSTSQAVRDLAMQMDQSTAVGRKPSYAIKQHLNGIVGFAMQYSVKTYLKPQKAEEVLEFLRKMMLLAMDGEDQYYWKRFDNIPKDRGMFTRAQCEYIMVGNAFLDLCGGKTGTQELDDSIRRIGADAFVNACKMMKKEIKAVRLYP